MHPILANKRALILYLTTWLLVGSLIDLAFIISSEFQLTILFLGDIPLYILYALICLSSYYLCKFFPIKTTKWYILVSIFLVAACTAAGFTLLIGHSWIQIIDSLNLASPIHQLYEPWILGIYVTLILLFLLIAATHYVIIAFEQSKDAERRSLELQLLAQDAELRALRAQIDPHFLFNSLNSISALIANDPAKARSMTIMLGDFFRKSLDLSTQKFILLKEELDLITEFLTIEQIRFGQRLKIEKRIQDICEKVKVPPLILQPLVENAVRHGIAHLIDGGTIEIACEARGEKIQIQIQNPLDPESPKSKRSGLGLKNVQSRLNTLYGNGAQVNFDKTDNFFRVKLTFPFK